MFRSEKSVFQCFNLLLFVPMQMENSLADMVLEVGYGCTQNAEECRNTLVQFGVREITPMSIARVLGMMARTPSGLTDQISVQVNLIMFTIYY